MPTLTPVQTLVEQLVPRFASGCTDEQILQLLTLHPIDPESLAPYIRFSDRRYTRNLIFKDERFEVLSLCWDRGITSRIHNHCDQRCWMTAPIGKLLVQNYRVVGGDERGGHCELRATDSFWLTPEQPGAVDPAQPIHTVGNPAELDEPAVSIHVYSYPYDTCMIYSLDEREARQVSLSYDTEYGVG